MSIVDQIRCGRIIIFNSMIAKNRWAFCLDYSYDESIIYRGLLGLKAVDKKTFLGFARVADVFDYMDRELSKEEKRALKLSHKTGIMTFSKTVQEYVESIFKAAKIELFVSPEGWKNEDIHTR